MATFYGVEVPYEGQELGVFKSVAPDDPTIVYTTIDVNSLEGHTQFHSKNQFVEYMKELRAIAVEPANWTPPQEYENQPKTHAEKSEALANTRRFADQVLAVLGSE